MTLPKLEVPACSRVTLLINVLSGRGGIYAILLIKEIDILTISFVSEVGFPPKVNAEVLGLVDNGLDIVISEGGEVLNGIIVPEVALSVVVEALHGYF